MLDLRKLAAMSRADLEAAYVRLDAQSRQAAPAPLKSGFLTTEFWSTILGQVSVLVAIVLAFQHPEVSTERLIVILIVAAGGGAALAGWYTGKRTDLKTETAKAANKGPRHDHAAVPARPDGGGAPRGRHGRRAEGRGGRQENGGQQR